MGSVEQHREAIKAVPLETQQEIVLLLSELLGAVRAQPDAIRNAIRDGISEASKDPEVTRNLILGAKAYATEGAVKAAGNFALFKLPQKVLPFLFRYTAAFTVFLFFAQKLGVVDAQKLAQLTTEILK
jgi:hypothetical protein